MRKGSYQVHIAAHSEALRDTSKVSNRHVGLAPYDPESMGGQGLSFEARERLQEALQVLVSIERGYAKNVGWKGGRYLAGITGNCKRNAMVNDAYLRGLDSAQAQ
jgi:hypothetical protein